MFYERISDFFDAEGDFEEDNPPGGECTDEPGCTAVSHWLSCPL